ncbi:hypothetical protein Tco_0382765, partial [Tanacetum coccineum]
LHLGFTIVVLDKQVEGMTRHKEVYVIPSHTKKVFANMKRPGKGFSGRVTPLFPTMMIQALEDMGEDSAAPFDSYSTPIISQPSSSKPQKKNLQEKVLNFEKAKTAQAKEIASLKKIVKVESSNDVSLGAQEDASKQGRKIADLDADTEVTLVDETQEMNEDNLMFEIVSVADPVTTASVQIPNELTLAQTLIEIKTSKPKPVTTAVTKITSIKPRAKGIIFHDQEEQVPISTKIFSSSQSQLPQVKDKGKGKMAEPEKSLKKKDQVALDEEIATNSSDICRLFLLIQSFSTSSDTTC